MGWKCGKNNNRQDKDSRNKVLDEMLQNNFKKIKSDVSRRHKE